MITKTAMVIPDERRDNQQEPGRMKYAVTSSR